jgi:8-amino-7-oxononanoate synthase
MKDRPLEKRLSKELDELERKAQIRSLVELPGVSLCSNDYLALSDDARLKAAVARAVECAGRVGATGSRLLSGHAAAWDLAEREFANFVGTEAALFFSSGYAANVGLLSAVLKPGDVVFSDALNHASLIDGVRLSRAEKVIYPHADLGALEAGLAAHRHSAGARVIVSESTFSMDGDAAPVEELLGLARRYDAELILDEAHATGVCGPEGRGRAAAAGREHEVFATMHPCGKALASVGAFVCGSETLKRYLINRARTFIFSTALPPYIAEQVRAALELARAAEDRRAHLREVAALLRGGLAASGFETREGDSPIVPVIFGDNEAALFYAEFLQGRGFAVRAIRPPTVPEGTSRLRLSLTARVTREDVQGLIAALGEAREELALAARRSGGAIPAVHA